MSLSAGSVEVVPSRRAEPMVSPDLESLEVGIRHLERLYLELGSLKVQLQEPPAESDVSEADSLVDGDRVD